MEETTKLAVGSKANGQVLFLHTNYPAQFRLLVKAYVARSWSVWFASHTTRHPPLPEVQHLPLPQAGKKGSKLDQLESRSKLAFSALLAAKREKGLYPERIYVHTGWGLGSFLRDIFPKSKIIAYSEWWFNLQSSDFLFDRDNPEIQHNLQARLSMLLRNQGFALELQQADLIVAPTEWQRSQLPPLFRERCRVIFDGIDQNVFSPGISDPDFDTPLQCLDRDSPLLTYATRGLEPYRGFPEFARAAEQLLQSRPQWHVAIAGKDEPSYFTSGATRKGFGAQAMERFKMLGFGNRVHYLGSLPLLTYRNLLRRSHLHCYFTRPYVLSWSLLESALTGCRLFVSNTEPVQEFLANDPYTIMVDHTQANLGSQLVEAADAVLSVGVKVSAEQCLHQRDQVVKRVEASRCVNQHLEAADTL